MLEKDSFGLYAPCWNTWAALVPRRKRLGSVSKSLSIHLPDVEMRKPEIWTKDCEGRKKKREVKWGKVLNSWSLCLR